MKNERKIGFLALLTLGGGLLIGCAPRLNGTEIEHTSVKIGDTEISAEVARTDETRKLGLSGRESLDIDTGLLFVYENPGLHGIWMKDMNFPIDIIWIGAEDSTTGTLRVFDMKKNAAPKSYPEVFTPRIPSSYVLEVNAGFADENGVNIGDSIRYQ